MTGRHALETWVADQLIEIDPGNVLGGISNHPTTVAVGPDSFANTNAQEGVSIGVFAALGEDTFGSVVIGPFALVTSDDSIALGFSSRATGFRSSAFGPIAEAEADYATAIGAGAEALEANQGVLGGVAGNQTNTWLVPGTLEVGTEFYLRSPDNTKWKLMIGNDGIITTEAVV